MKTTALIILSLACASCTAQTDRKEPSAPAPLSLSVSRMDLLWAEAPAFHVKGVVQSSPGQTKYLLPPREGTPFIDCVREDKKRVRVFQQGGAPPPGSSYAFPLTVDEANLAAIPLDVGRWECVYSVSYFVIDSAGNQRPLILSSNPIPISVKTPGGNDEALIRDAGMSDLLAKGDGFVGKDGMIHALLNDGANASPHSAVEHHPESSYFCRSAKSGLMPHIDFLTSDRFLKADMAKQDANWGPSPYGLKVKETLDNLEKYNCREFTPQQFAVLRTYNALDIGDFPLARKSAGQGLALNPEPAQRAFFDFILRFRDESEWLKQFKSVRRIGK